VWGDLHCSAVADDFVGEEGMQYLDDRFEPLEQFSIALHEFVKLSGLFPEYVKDRIRAVKTIELGSPSRKDLPQFS
jgi:hypothetical protein